MRRWPSRYPTTGMFPDFYPLNVFKYFNLLFFHIKGVITLLYQLPTFPSEGKWTIRVEAMSQIHDHHIIVERFYYRFFDVIHIIYFLLFIRAKLGPPPGFFRKTTNA
jgi:hypothetical protein